MLYWKMVWEQQLVVGMCDVGFCAMVIMVRCWRSYHCTLGRPLMESPTPW